MEAIAIPSCQSAPIPNSDAAMMESLQRSMNMEAIAIP